MLVHPHAQTRESNLGALDSETDLLCHWTAHALGATLTSDVCDVTSDARV